MSMDSTSTATPLPDGIPDWVPPLDRIDRGYLPGEPCRYCLRAGGVFFVVDDSPFGKTSAQATTCALCRNSWSV